MKTGNRKPQFKKRPGGKSTRAKFKKGPPQKKGGKKPKRPQAAAPAPARPAENPRAKALAQKMAQLALDKKALDVVILDVRGMTSYADYFVIASGESERQVTAIADHIQQQMKAQEGLHAIGTEGQDTGNWVLLDFGEVVAHLFFTEVRSFYDLEGLWADAPREQVLAAVPVPVANAGQPA